MLLKVALAVFKGVFNTVTDVTEIVGINDAVSGIAKGAVKMGASVVTGAYNVVKDGVEWAFEKDEKSLKQNVVGDEANFDWSKTPFKNSTDAKEQIIVAINIACADGVLTTEELLEVKMLRKLLKINDEEMKEIKTRVLKTLFDKISSDNQITEKEKKLYEDVQNLVF